MSPHFTRVEDGMPEYNVDSEEEYLCIFDMWAATGGDPQVVILTFLRGDFWHNSTRMTGSVIAWAPLPEAPAEFKATK